MMKDDVFTPGPKEHTVTVRDGERNVVLFRFLVAANGVDAIHALSRGLARDPDFGTGSHGEKEVTWPALGLRDGDLVTLDISASSHYYADELIRALARDLSEQIILAPGPGSQDAGEQYLAMARKLYDAGWRRVPDEHDEEIAEED